MAESISDKEKKYKDQYAKQEINLLMMYERVMKTLNWQLSLLENELTGGMNYSEKKLKPGLIKASADIGRIVEKLTKLHLQISQAEAKAAASRSLEDKIDFAVRFIRNLPPGFRTTTLDKLSEELMFNYQRKLPAGRPAQGYVHPLDRV